MKRNRLASIVIGLLLGANQAVAQTPTFTAPDTIRANEELGWNIPFVATNPFAVGLYADSVWLVSEDLDEGRTRLPRVTTTNLPMLVHVFGPVAANDSVTFDYSASPSSERARLTFHALLHNASGQKFRVSKVVIADGGPLTDRFRSTLLDAGRRKVEFVFMPAIAQKDTSPAVLLVHGPGSHARRMFRMAQMFVDKGWSVGLVSQPGYGRSAGPADLAGPATVAALEVALAKLKSSPGVDPSRIAAFGLSHGATAALLLGATHPELAGVVAQSASYDLWATYRNASAASRSAIITEAGPDSAGWKARSPLDRTNAIRCPVLVLHGELERMAPVSAAKAYVEALRETKRPVEFHYFPTDENRLPRHLANKLAMDFLSQRFAR